MARWARIGLAVAVALLATGLWFDRGADDNAAPRVVMIGVRSLSWQMVAEGLRQDRLPTLARLLDGETAVADVIATGYGSDAEVLASVITGRLPWKHGVHDAAQLRRYDRSGDPMRRTVWDWLGAQGEAVTALGFPLGERERLAGDAPLAEDLATAERAAKQLRADPRRHLFLYFDGLHRWQRDHGARGESLFAYYDEIDEILRSLVDAAGDHPTTWMLFSERGNHDGPIDYRPGFPRLAQWPPIGFFMAWGHGVKRSVAPQTIAPVDLATTLAYVSGNPVSNDMDGLVLFGMLDDGYYFQQRLAFRR